MSIKDPNDIKIDEIPTTAEELKAYEEKFGDNKKEEKTVVPESELSKMMKNNKEEYFRNLPSDETMVELVREELRTIYDPELPVNIYDLGLIYDIRCWNDEETHLKMCKITMTLTSATCSMSEIIVDLVKSIANRIEYLENVDVELVFDPPWRQDSMSDEAKLAMGLL